MLVRKVLRSPSGLACLQKQLSHSAKGIYYDRWALTRQLPILTAEPQGESAISTPFNRDADSGHKPQDRINLLFIVQPPSQPSLYLTVLSQPFHSLAIL
jgi:hypothetical protein